MKLHFVGGPLDGETLESSSVGSYYVHLFVTKTRRFVEAIYCWESTVLDEKGREVGFVGVLTGYKCRGHVCRKDGSRKPPNPKVKQKGRSR